MYVHVNEKSSETSAMAAVKRKETHRRKRDRELSRIPVKRILKAFKKKKVRKRVQSFV